MRGDIGTGTDPSLWKFWFKYAKRCDRGHCVEERGLVPEYPKEGENSFYGARWGDAERMGREDRVPAPQWLLKTLDTDELICTMQLHGVTARTQDQIAAYFGVSQGTVSRWLGGKMPDMARRLAYEAIRMHRR